MSIGDAKAKWLDAGESVTPDRLRLALERRFRRATAARTGAGFPLLTAYPEETAEEAMSIVTPVLESYDRQGAALAARVAELEAPTLPPPLDPPSRRKPLTGTG